MLSEEEIKEIQILESDTTTREEYIAVIDNWKNETPIFTILSGRENKVRFINFVLSIDDLDEKEYVGGTGDLGEATFSCYDFARESYRRLSLFSTEATINTALYLPSVVVQSFGYGSEANTYDAHAFNAVFLGENISEDNLSDYDNWYFYEPNGDGRIDDPFNYLVSNVGLLKLSMPLDDYLSSGDNLTFFYMNDSIPQGLNTGDGSVDRMDALYSMYQALKYYDWLKELGDYSPETHGFFSMEYFDIDPTQSLLAYEALIKSGLIEPSLMSSFQNEYMKLLSNSQ